jgi:hypothetical protein
VRELDRVDSIEIGDPTADLATTGAVHLKLAEPRHEDPIGTGVGRSRRIANSNGPYRVAFDLDPPRLEPSAARDPASEQKAHDDAPLAGSEG